MNERVASYDNTPVEGGRVIRNAMCMKIKTMKEMCTNKEIKIIDDFIFCNFVEMNRSKIKTLENISPTATKYDKKLFLHFKDKESEIHHTNKCSMIPFSNEENAMYKFQNKEKIADLKKGNIYAWKHYNQNVSSYLNTSKMKNSLCTTTNMQNKKAHFLFKCTKVELKTGIKLLDTHTFNCTVVVAVVLLRNNKNSLLVRNRKKNNVVWKNRLWKKILKCAFCNIHHLDEDDKILFKIKHTTKKIKNKKSKYNEKEIAQERAKVGRDLGKYKSKEIAKGIYDLSTRHFSCLSEKKRGDTLYSITRNSNEEYNTENTIILNKTNSPCISATNSEYTCETNSSVHNFTCYTSNKETDKTGELRTFRNKRKREYVLFFIIYKNKKTLNHITEKRKTEKKSVEGCFTKSSKYLKQETNATEENILSKYSRGYNSLTERTNKFPQIEVNSQKILEAQVTKELACNDTKKQYDIEDLPKYDNCKIDNFSIVSLNDFSSSESYFFLKIKSSKSKCIVLDKKHISRKLDLNELFKYLPFLKRRKLSNFSNTNKICNDKQKNRSIHKNKRQKRLYSCFLVEVDTVSTTPKKEVQWNVLQHKEEYPAIIASNKKMSSNNMPNLGISNMVKNQTKNSNDVEDSVQHHEPLKWEEESEWKDCLHKYSENVLGNHEQIHNVLDLDREFKRIWDNNGEEQRKILIPDNSSVSSDSNREYKIFLDEDPCINYSFCNNENEHNLFLNKMIRRTEEDEEKVHHEKREELQSERMNTCCFIDNEEVVSLCSKSFFKENEKPAIIDMVDQSRMLKKGKGIDTSSHFQETNVAKKENANKKKKLRTTEKQNMFWRKRVFLTKFQNCTSRFQKRTNLTCFQRKQNMLLHNTHEIASYGKYKKRKENSEKKEVEGIERWNENIEYARTRTPSNYSTSSCDKKNRQKNIFNRNANNSLDRRSLRMGLQMEEPFFELVDDVKHSDHPFGNKELEIELSDNKKYMLKKDVMNTIIPPGLSEEVMLQENIMNNPLMNESLMYKQEANKNKGCNRKKTKIKVEDDIMNKGLPIECVDTLLQPNCENKMTYDSVEHIDQRKNRNVRMYSSTNSNTTNSNTANSHGNSSNRNSYMNDSSYEYTNYENSYTNSYDRSMERSVDRSVGRCFDRSVDGRISDTDRNMDFEVEVMERHSSILVNRGIKTKKYVDYSLYNTYAKSSFLQCAEQADNHFIGNYLLNFQDENFGHLRQKIKLCLSRTFANLKTTSETCVLHFTNLIFDLYISKFGSKEEIIESITNEIATEEKQYSDVMIQLLKEFYPKIYNEFIHKEKLKNKFKTLYKELENSCDLIYHFIAVTCLFISQKYYNYRLISIDLIARTYCKSHMEGLSKIYSVSNELIKESSPDYYCITQYLDTTFSAHSVNKCFALEVELCILKKLNYDLSIPTAYSLLDSLLKGNENINFLKVRNDYNITEGEILLRVASIDNNFLKYKASTLAMAVYEILSFNISKDKMQKEWFPETEEEEEDENRIILPDEAKNRVDPDAVQENDRLVIAEEEERLIIATRYLNEKSKLHKIIKKMILKTCIIIKKKIPQYYYDYGHHLTADLKSYISTYKKSKRMFLKKLRKKEKAKKKLNRKNESAHNTQPNNTKKNQSQYQSKGKDKVKRKHKKNKKKKRKRTTQKNETCTTRSTENINPSQTKKELLIKTEKKEKVKNVSHEDAARMQIRKAKKEMKRENQQKREQREKKEEAALFGTIENTHQITKEEKRRKKCALLTTKKKKDILKIQQKGEKLDKNSSEYKFYVYRNKLGNKLKGYLKRISRLYYPELPEQFCSQYTLQGNKIRLYLRTPIIEKKNKKTSGGTKENPVDISKRASICGTPEKKQTRRDRVRHDKEEDGVYIIGSRTKSTDSHLIYYFNYISKLRSRLICGLKFILKRINKIEKTEVLLVTRNLKQLIKRNKKKKKEKQRKMAEATDNEKTLPDTKTIPIKRENKQLERVSKKKKRNIIKKKKKVSLLKQLHNEIKAFFLWLKKIADIEVRPLLKFTDLKFLHQANMYKKHYFKYVNKLLLTKGKANNSKKKQKSTCMEPSIQQELYDMYPDDDRVRGMIQVFGATDNGGMMDVFDRGGDEVSHIVDQSNEFNFSGVSDLLYNDYFEELKKTVVQDKTYFRELCEKYERREKLEDDEEEYEGNEGVDKEKELNEQRKMERTIERSIEEEFVDLQIIKGQIIQPQRRNTLRKRRNEQSCISAIDENRKRGRNEVVSGRRRDIPRDISHDISTVQKIKTNMYINAKQQRIKSENIVSKSRKPIERGRRDRDRNRDRIITEHNIQMDSSLKNHIFQIPPTVTPIRKTQNDWITINDPQVDECARELMESFLKWKNSDFISKNWTYSEYSHCKDYYYSLVFGDLKPPEALKGINEMMQMKYIHLLNIYYDVQLDIHQSEMLE